MAIVVACTLAVVVAAAVQHLVTLELELSDLRAYYFIVPAVVGAVFGVVFVRTLMFREVERRYVLRLKRREAQISAFNSELSERVEERTRELVDKERQLVHAQKMEAVGRLAGGVAHDFNNLLGGILGLTELLRDDLPAQSEGYRTAGEIIGAVQRAADLTRQLLTFGRQQVVRPAAVDLNDIARDLTPILRQAMGEGIAINIQPAARPLVIWADRSQIDQILLNLVINSRDAIEDAGEIRVATSLVPAGQLPPELATGATGDWALLEVEDNGIGMKEELRAQIFEPFFSTKPAHVGTGLGLSVVASVVEQNGGRVEAHSTLGSGTTMRVYLPLTDEEPLPAGQLTGEAAAGSGERILLVEDDTLLRDLLRRVLERGGYRVEALADGNEGLARLAKQEPKLDLMITDLILPGCPGTSLVRALLDANPAARVILMTGYGDQKLRAELDELPELPLLHKPFPPAALLIAVREVLDN